MHNPAALTKYIKLLNDDKTPTEAEGLTKHELYNDLIITSLRTRRGIDTEELKKRFGNMFHDYFMSQLRSRIQPNLYERCSNGAIRLTQEGILVSDSVFTELIWV